MTVSLIPDRLGRAMKRRQLFHRVGLPRHLAFEWWAQLVGAV